MNRYILINITKNSISSI